MTPDTMSESVRFVLLQSQKFTNLQGDNKAPQIRIVEIKTLAGQVQGVFTQKCVIFITLVDAIIYTKGLIAPAAILAERLSHLATGGRDINFSVKMWYFHRLQIME